MPDTYFVNNRSQTRQLNWLQAMGGGAQTGDRPVITFAARKGITRVPMGYQINGAAGQIFGTALMTDGLSDCESIVLLGCDAGNVVQHIAFAHVVSGDTKQVDWNGLTAGIVGVQPNVYAIIDSSATHVRDTALGDHVTKNNYAPSGMLTYFSGTGRGGRNFGIESGGTIGEIDAALVERNKAAKLDGQLTKQGFITKSPAILQAHGAFSMKTP